jgi:hypothetical protein
MILHHLAGMREYGQKPERPRACNCLKTRGSSCAFRVGQNQVFSLLVTLSDLGHHVAKLRA